MLAEEFLRPLGLSVHALALALRVPATRVGAIVKGDRSVSADTALRLARFFGTSAEFWIGLQAMHDLPRQSPRSARRSRAMFNQERPECARKLVVRVFQTGAFLPLSPFLRGQAG